MDKSVVWRWVHSPYNEFKFTSFKEKTLDVYDLLAVKRRRLAGVRTTWILIFFQHRPQQFLRLSPVLTDNFKNLVKVLQLIMHQQNGKKTNLFDDAMHYKDISEDLHFPRNNSLPPFFSDMVSWILPSILHNMTTSFTPIPFFFPAWNRTQPPLENILYTYTTTCIRLYIIWERDLKLKILTIHNHNHTKE